MALSGGVGRNSGKPAVLSGGERVLEGLLAWGAPFERQGRRKPTKGGWTWRHAVGEGGGSTVEEGDGQVGQGARCCAVLRDSVG
jgi:hypothetical protein